MNHLFFNIQLAPWKKTESNLIWDNPAQCVLLYVSFSGIKGIVIGKFGCYDYLLVIRVEGGEVKKFLRM